MDTWSIRKNKPKTNPNKAKTNPNKAKFKKAKMNVNKVLTKGYENKSNWAICENKPNLSRRSLWRSRNQSQSLQVNRAEKHVYHEKTWNGRSAGSYSPAVEQQLHARLDFATDVFRTMADQQPRVIRGDRQEMLLHTRHLITMTSGLSDRSVFQHKPGTRWRYNTRAYARSVDVVAAAAKMDRHELTRKWLTKPIGMADSTWVSRRAIGAKVGNSFGFATTARDLARFGLMVLAGGKWGDKTILGDQQYIKEATTTSQRLNPYYGYLWWVNSNANAPKQAPSIATAPKDTFSAKGALNRRCFVAPGLQLVVTRLGDQPIQNNSFDRQLWKLIMEASPGGK